MRRPGVRGAARRSCSPAFPLPLRSNRGSLSRSRRVLVLVVAVTSSLWGHRLAVARARVNNGQRGWPEALQCGAAVNSLVSMRRSVDGYAGCGPTLAGACSAYPRTRQAAREPAEIGKTFAMIGLRSPAVIGEPRAGILRRARARSTPGPARPLPHAAHRDPGRGVASTGGVGRPGEAAQSWPAIWCEP